MKNYYAEFLQRKISGNILDNEVSKVSKACFLSVLASFDTFDTDLPNDNQKIFIAGNLTERLNSMFPGASVKVSIDDFQFTGADKLTNAEKDFLAVNKIQILCTLQQGLLVRHLFSQKPELREIFVSKIQTRDGHLEAASEITTKWFARLLDTMPEGLSN